MAGSERNGGYVPPLYIPLGQSDQSLDDDADDVGVPAQRNRQDSSSSTGARPNSQPQWTSGICACFDDIPSCCIGLICPCFLFGKNAEFLGSGTLVGSCMTHCILWGLVNALCCLLSDGALCGLPGCFVACYACGYRRALRSKYNLPEAPCGDLTTHLCCHMCAICQEYREIRDRSGSSGPLDFKIAEVTAPAVQTMELPSKQ